MLVYWMMASGITFFIPLAVIRSLQGSITWQRWLSALALWGVYCLGTYCGLRLRVWVTAKRPLRPPPRHP